MKKAVIVMMVALFAGNAFASGSCKNKSNTSLVSSTKASSGSTTASDSTTGTK